MTAQNENPDRVQRSGQETKGLGLGRKPALSIATQPSKINHDGLGPATSQPILTPGGSIIEAALVYISLGWPVFPCDPQTKRPLVRHWKEDASTRREDVLLWWNKTPNALIGLPCGPSTDLLVIDVDIDGSKQGAESLAALEAKFGPLGAVLSATTGGGGLHLFFKWSPGHGLGNARGALPPDIDVRGDGGYIIAAPSVSVKGQYFYNEDTSVFPPELTAPPAWLVEIIKTPKSRPGPVRQALTPQGSHSGTGHPYTAAMLESLCAEIRATPGGQRNQKLNNAAIRCGHFIPGGRLSRGDAERELSMAGSLAGLDEREMLATLKSGIEAGLLEPKDPPQNGRPQPRPGDDRDIAAPEPSANDDWGPAIPFEAIETPPFPLEALPPVLKDFVTIVSESIQVPPGLVLINALACMAVAIQGKARVVVSTEYSEPMNLYMLAALPPGERKSAVVEICKAPLLDWQKREAELKASDRKKALSERKSQEKLIESRRSQLIKIKDEDERRAEISAIGDLEAGLPDVPALPRLFADDTTPEALAILMAAQGERLGVIEAEAGLFETLAGRYSNGVPNIDLVLKAWNGEPVMIDRRRGEPVSLEKPMLTVCVSAQPEVVAGLTDKPGFRGRGLLARFFYVLPESRVGYRSVDVSPVPDSIKRAYAAKLETALEVRPFGMPDGTIEPHAVRLSSEAESLRRDFAEHVEISMRPDGQLESLKEWASKLPGNMLRLAGLLHFWAEDRPQDSAISGQTMNTAITLAAVMAEHCRAAFQLMRADDAVECAKAILKWLTSERLNSFTARACLRKIEGRWPKMEQVDLGLAILEDRGYIQPEVVESPKRGRPSRGYLVNPALI